MVSVKFVQEREREIGGGGGRLGVGGKESEKPAL